MNTVNPPTQPGALPVSGPGKLSGLAIASLVLGILGFCSSGLLGVIGLILGIIALVSISNSQGQKRGTGFAIAGVICSVCSFITIIFMIGMLLPALGKARQVAQGAQATSNLRMISMGGVLYADANNDLLPPADDWKNVLLDGHFITAEQLLWPNQEDDGRCFAMNALLDGLTLSSIQDPSNTIFFFEVAPGSPLAGGPELLAERPNDRRGYIVSFVDGHSEWVTESALADRSWDPN